MYRLLFVLLFALLSASVTVAQDPPPNADRQLIFDFESESGSRWGIVNDGVMGGRSTGNGKIEEGVLHFWGNLVTQGGGFTSVRTRTAMDLSAYDGLELRVRGGGRTFEVELSDGTRYRGRTVSRRAAFDTTSDWETVRVPFSSFRSSIFGQPVDAGRLDASGIRSLGLYILDGIDGEFQLQVREIRAYRDTRI